MKYNPTVTAVTNALGVLFFITALAATFWLAWVIL